MANLSSTASSSTNASFVDVKPSLQEIGLKDSKAAAASLAKAFSNDEVAFYFLNTAHKQDIRRSEDAT